jgi:hypothetical protein
MKKVRNKSSFYFIFTNQHLTSYLLLSGPALTEKEEEGSTTNKEGARIKVSKNYPSISFLSNYSPLISFSLVQHLTCRGG